MEISATINTIAITCYFLIFCLFIWISRLPNSDHKSTYWCFAVLSILLARVYLSFPFLGPEFNIPIYAVLLGLEKSFLIVGFYKIFQKSISKSFFIKLGIFFAISTSATFIFSNIIGSANLMAISLAVTQTLYLFFIAMFVRKQETNWLGNMQTILPVVATSYAVFWLSFPIAIHVDVYMSIGFVIGNIFNMVNYVCLAYMLLLRFESRMLDAEVQARRLAEEALQSNLAKGKFLANMSHEIRTPMNGVITILSLLKESPLTDKQKSQVNIAYDSGKNLVALIGDILDLSKIEAGKLQIEKVESNLVALFEDSVNILQGSIDKNAVNLILDASDIQYSKAITDPVRLKQILTNLISNAIKFTHEGEILISAQTTQENEQEFLRFSVKDTGIGIETSELPRIFSDFEQADTSTTRSYGGTGLGLTISKNLCELLGGEISVQSEAGKGSCFNVSIPIAPCGNLGVPRQEHKVSKKNILVVDSSSSRQKATSSQLICWGFNAVCASDAKQALKICEEHHYYFDLVIIELEMHNMNGEHFARLLRAKQKSQNILLLLLSNDPNIEYTNEITATNFDYFLVKPLLPSQLLSAIETLETRSKRTSPVKALENSEINWGKNHRILLVEDNEINRIVAEQVLDSLNMRCEIAVNGAEALNSIKEATQQNRPFSHVIMDCQMPVMDGYEATKKIREGFAGAQNKDIVIIALTANAMQIDRDRCLSAGMDDYLSKPIDTQTLKNTLDKWMNVKRFETAPVLDES